MACDIVRRRPSTPLDHCKEVIGAYRRIMDDIDIRRIVDNMNISLIVY